MTNLTITGDWRQRIRGVEPWLTRQIPAKHRAQRYERCPWVWPGLHIRLTTREEAQFEMAQTAPVVRFMGASGLRPYLIAKVVNGVPNHHDRVCCGTNLLALTSRPVRRILGRSPE